MAPVPELEDVLLDDSERDASMKETTSRKRNQSYKRKSTGGEEIVEEVKKRKSNPNDEQQPSRTEPTDEESLRADSLQSPDVRRKSTGLRTKPQPNQQVFITRKHKSLPNNNVVDEETSYQTPKKTNIDLPVTTPKIISLEKPLIPSRNRSSSSSAFSLLASLLAVISIVYLLYVQYAPLEIPTSKEENTLASNNNTVPAPIIKYFYVTNNVTSNVNHSEIFGKLIEKHSKQFKNNLVDLIDTRLYELERKLNNNIRSSISSNAITAKKDQQKELEKLKETLLSKISEEVDSILSVKLKSVNDINEQSISDLKGRLDTIIPGVKNLIDESLDKYDADKIGLTDYALSSLGSKIVEHSPSYSPSKFWPQLFAAGKTPDMIINPDTTIGNCWPMKGASGFVVIEIAHSIIPTSFSIDHVPKALSPNISSAPKQISVFGYETQTSLTKLAAFEYDVHGSPTQTFPLNESTTKKYNKFRFQISGNYGNSFYTCIYRFRIHGEAQAMMLN